MRDDVFFLKRTLARKLGMCVSESRPHHHVAACSFFALSVSPDFRDGKRARLRAALSRGVRERVVGQAR